MIVDIIRTNFSCNPTRSMIHLIARGDTPRYAPDTAVVGTLTYNHARILQNLQGIAYLSLANTQFNRKEFAGNKRITPNGRQQASCKVSFGM